MQPLRSRSTIRSNITKIPVSNHSYSQSFTAVANFSDITHNNLLGFVDIRTIEETSLKRTTTMIWREFSLYEIKALKRRECGIMSPDVVKGY